MRIVSALQAKVFHLPYYNIDDIKKIYRFFMYDIVCYFNIILGLNLKSCKKVVKLFLYSQKCP